MGDSYAIRAILSAVDNLSPVLQKVEGSVQQFGSRVEANYGAVGKAMVGVGAATTAMGMTSLKSFGQFQQSLNTAAVVAGGTAKDIDGLANVANKMGADLPISAQDASDAMVEMARNGASVGQIKEQFPAIAQAATAAGSNLQATAGVVQQAMNIWGDSLKSPSQAAEILVQTANMSNASIEDMQQALATIGGTAKLACMSLADISEAIGFLTNKGFSAAQASDDLNHAILQMMAPSKVAQGTMNDLGLSFVDASGKMKPFPQILQEVADSMDGLSKSEQTAALKSMFGTAGMQAIAPLLDAVKNKTNDSANSWDAWSNKVDNAAGTSKRAEKSLKDQAAEMQKNVGSSLEQLGGNWEQLRNVSMNSAKKVNGGMIKIANEGLVWAGTSKNWFAQVIRGFIGLAPVIGPATTAIGGFLTGATKIFTVTKQAAHGLYAMAKGAVNLVAKLLPIGGRGKTAGAGLEETAKSSRNAGKSAGESSGSIMQLGLAILEIGAGVGLATAGMAALVLATSQLAKQGLAGVGTLLAVTVALSALIGVMALAGKLVGAMGPSALMAYAGMALLVASFSLLVAAVTQFASTGKAGIEALVAITGAVVAMVAAFALAGPVLTASAVGLIAFGAAILMVSAGIALINVSLAALITAFNQLGGSISSIVPTFTALGKGMASMITSFVKQIMTSIPLIASAVANLLTQLVVQVSQHITTIANAVMQMFVQILAVIAQNMPVIMQQGMLIIQGFLQGILQGIPMIVTYVGQITVAFLNALTAQLPSIIQAGVSLIVAFIEGIAQGLPQVISAALDLLQAFVDGIGQNMSRVIDIAMDAVMQFVYGVGYALGSIIASGGKLIQMFIKGIMNGLSGSRNAGKSNADSAKNGISSVSLISAGADLIKGLINGMGQMAHEAYNFAASIANNIKNKIQSALKIHSPSRVMRDEVGVYIPAGIAVGMLRNVDAVTAAAETLANAAVVSVPPIQTDQFTSSVNAIQNRMQNMSSSVDGTLTADNAGMTNLSSQLWRSRMEELVGVAVDKLDNVDQHPMIGLDTANRLNDYNNKINAQNLIMWKE